MFQLSFFERFSKKPEITALRPCIKRTWLELRKAYFPNRPDLDEYSVIWSNRIQTRTLASCNIWKRKVYVARVMDNPECFEYISALLYHEMCHAVLGTWVQGRNGRMNWHCAHFKRLEARHPGIELLDKWIQSGGWNKAVRRYKISKQRLND